MLVSGPQVRDAECMRLFAGSGVMIALGEEVVKGSEDERGSSCPGVMAWRGIFAHRSSIQHAKE